MNVDEIFLHIGEFGPYQKVIYIILNLFGIIHGTRMFIAVFLLYTPSHRCAIPSYPNDTYEVQSVHHADLISQFIPNNTEDDGDNPYDKCHIYSGDGLSNLSSGAERPPMTGCDRWVYDKSLFQSTLVMEFNAVCDDSMMVPHSQTSLMAGFLFGVLFFGAIGDKFGRKVAIYMAAVLYIAGGMAQTWAPQAGYIVFVLLRFFNGAAVSGAFTAVCVLSVEMVGVNKRIWVGVLIHWSFALGALLVDLIAYFLREWSFINIAGTAPAFLTLVTWWIIPESPRWLVKKGRMKEAEAVLRSIAKYNGKTLPEDLVNGMADKVTRKKSDSGDTGSGSKGMNGGSTANDKSAVNNGKPSDTIQEKTTANLPGQSENKGVVRDFFRMFTHRVLLIRSLVIFLNWFAVSMAYYGLSLTASQLAVGGLFTNFTLSMCMDSVATVLLLLLLDRWGRRPFHAANMIVGGAGSLVGVLTTMVLSSDLQWITVVVAMIGKIGSSAGFILIYIYSSELYPTTVRSNGMGVSSAWARVGGILAFYVQQWSIDLGGDFGHAFHLLVFGSFSLTAGLLTFLLPETLHKNLPETIEDGLEFGKHPEEDERVDPQKAVEVYTIDNVQIEMETFHTPEAKSATSKRVVHQHH